MRAAEAAFWSTECTDDSEYYGLVRKLASLVSFVVTLFHIRLRQIFFHSITSLGFLALPLDILLR
jgi:hypothetical protein